MAVLILEGSVGEGKSQKGIPHNLPSDVATVRKRLVQLGYAWVSSITLGTEKIFVQTIRLIQSMCKGSGKLDKGDGRIDLYGETHRWLAAENAPGWANIFGRVGYGWKATTDLRFGEANGGFTSTWMEERLRWAGFEYMTKAFFSISDAPPLWIRDCSPEKGGNARDHVSHETGLDVDIRLPLLPPHTNDYFSLEGKDYSRLFHFEAALIQVKAIRAKMDPKELFFNDPRFIKLGLSTHQKNHGDHYHVRIKPPFRVEGTYK